MTGVRVREATAADAKTLALLIGELLTYHAMPVPEDFEAALRRDGFGPRPRFRALIAEVDGEPAGMTLFYPTYRPSLTRPGLLMEDLYVREVARRKGVAQALLARLAAIVSKEDYDYIEWTTERENAGAHEFYARVGARRRDSKLCYVLDAAALRALAAKFD